MAQLMNRKILRITDKNKTYNAPEFITEDVVEVRRAKLIYYKWISRFMAFLATLSLLYGICAILSIMKLAPEIVNDVQIFTELSDSKSMVKREHINRRMESREKIMINAMLQYVELRNTYIKEDREMNNRWLWGGLVSYLSTYRVYKQFEKEFPKLRAEMKANDSSRSVEILSIERSGGEKSNTWKVEFKTYDYTYKEPGASGTYRSSPLIIEKLWTANIRCYADHERRIAYRRLINPLGFVVYSYFQSEIEI